MITVCLTSNQYHKVLTPFAHYWNRFAGADRHVVIGCYDAPLPTLPPNFRAVRIGAQADYDWSSGLERLIDVLLCKEDLILLLLEDYFLTEPPDWGQIEYARATMETDERIGKFDLSDDRRKLGHSIVEDAGEFGRIILSDATSRFQTSLQAAIWRTDLLYELLRVGESPWQFEKAGTDRWIEKRQSGESAFRDDPYNLIYGFTEPPLWYANAVGGAGGKPGQIEAKHMPKWMWEECRQEGWLDG